MDFFDDSGVDQIYISGLPQNVTEEKLAEYFGQIGQGAEGRGRGPAAARQHHHQRIMPAAITARRHHQDGQEEAPAQAQGGLSAAALRAARVAVGWEGAVAAAGSRRDRGSSPAVLSRRRVAPSAGHSAAGRVVQSYPINCLQQQRQQPQPPAAPKGQRRQCLASTCSIQSCPL